MSKPRIRAVMEGVIALSPQREGFKLPELVGKVGEKLGSAYSSRQASHDVKKLRAKGLVSKREHSRCYMAPAEAVRSMAAIVTLREKVLKPLLVGVGKRKVGRKPKNRGAIDVHYEAVQQAMQGLLKALKIAA